MRHFITLYAIALIALLPAGLAFAQQHDAPADQPKADPADANPQPAAADKSDEDQPAEPKTPEAKPGDAKELQATVVDVQGSVVYRSASKGGKFEPVTKGMKLGADTVVSAGRKSYALFSFGQGSALMLEQLSIMTLSQLYETRAAEGDDPAKPKVVTRVKLVNGSVRAGVQKAKTNNDFQVSTPVATLSVRGTRVIQYTFNLATGDLTIGLTEEGSIAVSWTGAGETTKTILLDPKEKTDQNLLLAILHAQFEQHLQLGDPWGQTLQEYVVEVFNRGALQFGNGDEQEFINELLREFNTPDSRGDSISDDDSDDTFFPDGDFTQEP